MIIKVENLKSKGYFTRIINKREKIYDELIEKHATTLENLESLYAEDEPRGNPEIFYKRVEDMSKEEIEILYQRAIEMNERSPRHDKRYEKNLEDLDIIDLKILQKDLSTYGEKLYNEIIAVELEYEDNLVRNLIFAKNSTYIFSLNKDNINTYNFIYFKKYARKLIEMGKDIRFVVYQNMSMQDNLDRVNYMYTEEEFELLKELDFFLNKHAAEGVLFREFLEINDENDLLNSWTLEQVVNVNNQIDKIVNVIKRKNLSPFETMIFLHKFLTSNFRYNKGGLEESRVLPGIYYKGKIVCSGYATLVKAVLDKLNDENLKAQLVGCKLYKNKEPYELTSSHCHNLIYIKDEKYQIDGYYIEDATFDSKKMFEGPKQDGGFAHCLLPINALRHLREYIYANPHSKDRYGNVIINSKNMKGIKEKYRPFIDREYGKYSKPIDQRKYIAAMNVVFDRAIENGKFNIDEELTKSRNRAHSTYTHAAELTFTLPESRLLRAIFGKRRIK